MKLLAPKDNTETGSEKNKATNQARYHNKHHFIVTFCLNFLLFDDVDYRIIV